MPSAPLLHSKFRSVRMHTSPAYSLHNLPAYTNRILRKKLAPNQGSTMYKFYIDRILDEIPSLPKLVYWYIDKNLPKEYLKYYYTFQYTKSIITILVQKNTYTKQRIFVDFKAELHKIMQNYNKQYRRISEIYKIHSQSKPTRSRSCSDGDKDSQVLVKLGITKETGRRLASKITENKVNYSINEIYALTKSINRMISHISHKRLKSTITSTSKIMRTKQLTLKESLRITDVSYISKFITRSKVSSPSPTCPYGIGKQRIFSKKNLSYFEKEEKNKKKYIVPRHRTEYATEEILCFNANAHKLKMTKSKSSKKKKELSLGSLKGKAIQRKSYIRKNN